MKYKKTIPLLLLISISSLGYATTSSTEQTTNPTTNTTTEPSFNAPNFEDHPIICPYRITFIEPSSEYSSACKKSNYAEILTGSPTLPSAYKKEIERFNETINQIYRDNVSNINFLATKGVFDLRIHNQCLRDICQTVFEQCTAGNIWNTSTVLSQQKQCNQKVDTILLAKQADLKKALYLNQSRKSQEVIYQQYTGILSRMRRNLGPAAGDMQRQYEKLSHRITTLVKNPQE